jgi:hypothetical protein
MTPGMCVMFDVDRVSFAFDQDFRMMWRDKGLIPLEDMAEALPYILQTNWVGQLQKLCQWK